MKNVWKCAGICLCALFCIAALTVQGHEFDDAKSIGGSSPPGIGGTGPFDSFGVCLLSQLELSDIGGGPANVLCNDCWGWTDSLDDREYAIVGLTNGTSFVDITDPTNPLYLGKLPTYTGNKAWRDMKVYNDHCYIVSDGNGAHGLQIFDLKLLRTADPENPQVFAESGHYAGFNNAHNIAINEGSGFAYIVGANVASGGLRALDLNTDPLNPTIAGSFSADGYTHDVQVVNYIGPDTDYPAKEIAFASNEDTLTIVDVTDKANMAEISATGYPGSEYSHQGWLSEDQRFFFMNDELDEWRASTSIKTRTHIWNVQDLDAPLYLGYYNGVESSIDHNLYTRGRLIFQGNYSSGMRVLRIDDPANPTLNELAFFDSYPSDNNVSFNGVWSVFPYFPSGRIIISDRQNGLFVVEMESQWIDFTEESSRILFPTNDDSVKNFAVADFDSDGDDDIVCVRRETASGAPMTNLVVQNNDGQLSDRTANFAPEFSTPDAATDAAVLDANVDAFPDLIVANGNGESPRLFMNRKKMKLRLGNTTLVRWKGFEELTNWYSPAFPSPPNFQSVATGDVTGDGRDDLYFVDADNDLEDRLLVNTPGKSSQNPLFFHDETSSRMTPAMASSGSGTKALIGDFNNDGWNDILKLSASGSEQFLRLLINDQTGHFSVMQDLPFNQASTFSVGDFDNNGRTDIFVVSDAQDYLILNISTIALGNIQTSTVAVSDSLVTAGFGGKTHVHDFDGDGFLDVAISDVDSIVGDCNGSFRILKGNGNESIFDPNDALDFDWNSGGVFDTAMIDLNGDDRPDLIQGTCEGWRVFILD